LGEKLEGVVEGFEGQADDVGGAAVEDGEVGVVGELEGVGAGTVLPESGAEVFIQFRIREGSELDEGAFLPGELAIFGSDPEADAGPELVGATGEESEDTSGLVAIGGFADDLAIDPGDGVGGEDDGVGVVGCDGVGFAPGQFGDIALAVTVGCVGGFIQMSGVNIEGVARSGQELASALGGTGQNQAAGEWHRRGKRSHSSRRVHNCSTVRVW
jgi:hypothetical protein